MVGRGWCSCKLCITRVFNNHNERFSAAYAHRTPLGRMADIDEITGIFIYLLSDSSRYCTGQNFVIDGVILLGNTKISQVSEDRIFKSSKIKVSDLLHFSYLS